MLNKVMTWKGFLIMEAICTGIAAIGGIVWLMVLYWDRIKSWGDRMISKIVKLFRR